MPTVLFICTANRYRSPIAEACFKRELEKRSTDGNWEARSAGTWTTDGLPAISGAIKSAQRLGLDISDHSSQVITAELVEDSSLVLVMEHGQKEALHQEFPSHREKILLLSEVSRGIAYDIPDPMGEPSVGDVVREICKLIEDGFDKIIELANK